jgi:hypothetical protein
VDRGTGHGRRAIGHLGAETEPNRNRNEIETETAPAVGSRTAFFNPSPAFAGFEVDPRAYGLGMSPRPAHRSLAVGLAVAALAGCPKRYETDLRTPEQRGQLDRESKYLKVHMRDGRLYVLGDVAAEHRQGPAVDRSGQGQQPRRAAPARVGRS